MGHVHEDKRGIIKGTFESRFLGRVNLRHMCSHEHSPVLQESVQKSNIADKKNKTLDW